MPLQVILEHDEEGRLATKEVRTIRSLSCVEARMLADGWTTTVFRFEVQGATQTIQARRR